MINFLVSTIEDNPTTTKEELRAKIRNSLESRSLGRKIRAISKAT